MYIEFDQLPKCAESDRASLKEIIFKDKVKWREFDIFFTALEQCKSVKVLCFDHTSFLSQISNESFQRFCQIISTFSSLQSLSLAANGLEELPVEKLCILKDALSKCKNLFHLGFGQNKLYLFSEDQMKVFADTLVTCSQLRSVNLRYTLFCDGGSFAWPRLLGQSIAQCQNLQHLNLVGWKLNKASQADLQYLGEMLEGSSSLKTLILDKDALRNLGSYSLYFCFGTAPWQQFLNALAKSKTVIEILGEPACETLFPAGNEERKRQYQIDKILNENSHRTPNKNALASSLSMVVIPNRK